jgi:L-iditol 2-dehydrogenase
MDLMQAAQLTGLKTLEVREVPLPPLPAEDGVLIRVEAVGICGSDVHYYRHGRIGKQRVEYPFTIGHECTGTVEMCGPLSRDLAPGDRVAVDPAVSCLECDQCRAGRPHTCRRLRFLGCPGQLPGCLSEFIVMPARNCYRIPEALDTELAVLAEPLAIGMYAADFLRNTGAEKIGILGTGPIGLSVLLAAQASGIQTVYATDKVDARSQAAKNLGAVWTGNPDRGDIVSEILKQERGLDAVFECCGDPEALNQAVELLNPGGTLLVLGIPEDDRVSLDVHSLRRREIRIQNVRRQNDYTERALELLAGRAIDASSLVTHRFSLAEAQQALELVSDYGDDVIKAKITLT